MKKIFELDFRGRKLIVENGELAKQAHGSILVRYGDTAVLSVSVMGKNMISSDFFPLTVLNSLAVQRIPVYCSLDAQSVNITFRLCGLYSIPLFKRSTMSSMVLTSVMVTISMASISVLYRDSI